MKQLDYQNGHILVELLAAIALLGIVAASNTSLLVSGLRSLHEMAERVEWEMTCLNAAAQVRSQAPLSEDIALDPVSSRSNSLPVLDCVTTTMGSTFYKETAAEATCRIQPPLRQGHLRNRRFSAWTTYEQQ